MKIKNIVFSGFAAAILMGTVNAQAAFEIASKAYVDSKVGDNGTITQAVTEIQNSLGDGIGTGAGETTVADALDGKVDKTAVSTEIPAAANASNDKWASEKAVADAIATVSGSVSDVQQQIADALGDLGTHEDPTSGETVPNTVEEVLETKADAEDVGNVDDLAQDIAAEDIVGAINELNTEKQNEADSNVATAGNYIAAGHGVASNLTALDTQLKATTDTANAAVPRNMNGTNGKALIFNETDGGGAKFEHSDGTNSFTGVNDGGANGIAAQIYAVDKTSKTGARIDVSKGGMYYTVGNDSYTDRMVAANEIATKGDIANAIGDSNSGLTGDVADLKETMGTGTLTGFGNGVDTVIEALNDLQSNKLNKPIPDTCTAQSQHCVLHRDQAGNLSWVDITVPYAD